MNSILLVAFSHAACPKMQKSWKYSVDDKKFKDYYSAKAYIRNLKKMEDGWKKLEVSKETPYRYQTKWIYQTEDHGFYCVCPECRKSIFAVRGRHSPP